MKKIYVKEIVKAVGGKLLYWKDNKEITSVIYFDSRPRKKSLYFLNDFVDEENIIKRMKRYEVTGVIVKPHYDIDVSKWKKAEIGLIEVTSMRNAYLDLAKYYRQLFRLPMIEVIGSSGKTTTKEIIGCVLKQGFNTLVGYENYNAPSGVAYNIFDLEEGHEACVLEVGMQGFGIMDLSTSLIKPNIAVVTSIQRAHLSSLGSIDNIIKAKSEILNYLAKNDTLIINGDDVNCLNMPLQKFKGKLYTFGLDEGNDIYAKNINYENGLTTFDAVYEEKNKIHVNQYSIKTFGKYNVRNALAAILIGYLLNIPVKSIKSGLLEFTPIHGRQEIIKGINNSTIINDNFNANPESTQALIEELPQVIKDKPLLLVLGDIERPSESIYARNVHYEIGKKLKDIKLNYLLLVGKWAKEYQRAALEDGIDEKLIYYCEQVQDALPIIKKLVVENSIVVFKAQKAYINFSELIEKISF